jgi:hypothetical protein
MRAMHFSADDQLVNWLPESRIPEAGMRLKKWAILP